MAKGLRLLVVGMLCGMFIAGCSFAPTDDDQTDLGSAVGADAADGDQGAGSGVETGAISDDDALQLDPLDDPESPLAERIIYFDFDRSDIRSEFLTSLESHARYMVDNPSVRLRLEGHADERGSREYNIGLGDRRGQSVRRILLFQGVAAGQISTVSYGEERPAVDGHSEQAWAQNRRVELVYIR
ncbi:MAG: peptidoglycan-associated lipoprotein Pal [Gammaproteobacteria bacterium]|nr:peptidoglycan-associated lipoprotein Pal [Gammaproteobacteria bacterium]